MTSRRDPELIVNAWLDDGPTDLPPDMERSIAIAVRTLPQAHSRLDRLARRTDMTRFQTLGLVAAVAIVAVVGVVALATFGGRQPDVGVQPSVTVPATPTPSGPPLTETFTSDQHGFSIGHPADWSVFPATDPFVASDWIAQGRPQGWVDVVRAPGGGTAGSLRVVSSEIPPGTTAVDLMAPYTNCAASCQTLLTDTTIAGLPAQRMERVEAGQEEVWALVSVGERAYVFTLAGGDSTGEWPVLEGVPALFDAMMATVELHPEDVTAGSTAAP